MSSPFIIKVDGIFDEISNPVVVDTTTTDTNSPFYSSVVSGEPAMILTFNGSGSITLPLEGNFTVDWGDGSLTNNATGTPSGPVKITGNVTKFGNGDSGWTDADRLTALTGWGNISGLVDLSGAFYGATSLTSVPATLPSTVTNLSYMFYGAAAFNGNISGWNTAAVTDMSHMFEGAAAFNKDLSSWNTGLVTDMSYMFAGATAFLGYGLEGWVTNAVTDMSHMFEGATVFNGNISGWNTVAVTDMSHMFEGATAFNKDLSSWNTGLVTDMSHMFEGATAFNQNISTWDTGLVTDMSHIFEGATTFPGYGLEHWVTSAVTDMSHMFEGATVFNGNISGWNTELVTDMSHMFEGATVFNGNISRWNTAAVTDMSHMFEGATVFPGYGLEVWVTSAVTDMSYMFYGAAAFNGNISGWNTAAVTDMSHMFASATDFYWDISGWNTAAVTNMSGMFNGAAAFNQNLSTWNTELVTNMSGMFQNATAFNGDISGWNTAAVTNMSGMFNGAAAFNQNLSTWNTELVTNMSGMFASATTFNKDLSSWNTGLVTDMSHMFEGATAFNQNLSTWNTGLVTDMSYMFRGANAYNADIFTVVTSVLNMSHMFASATAFNQDLSSWNTGLVTDMSYMFEGAATFNQNLSTWNTGLVTDMSYMFEGAAAFNQNLSTWNTGLVTDMSYMFASATAFVGTGLDKWKPRAATNMSQMFNGASSLSINLKPWCAYLGVLTGPVLNTNFFTQSTGGSGSSASPITDNPKSPWYTGYTTAPSRTPMEITFQPTPYTLNSSQTVPPSVSGTAYISLPISGVSGDIFIDWGDGTTNLYSQNQQPTRQPSPSNSWTLVEVYEHVDLSGSNHQVKIYGDFATFGERYNSDAKITPGNKSVIWFGLHNVLSVVNWGDNAILASMAQAFQQSALALTTVPSNIPRTVKNTAAMFLATPLFVGSNLGLWDVSGLTNVSSMFAGAAAFTADLSGWTYKLGAVSSYDNFFSAETNGMTGLTDPTSQSPRSPFYTGVPTPSNPYVPAAPLVVFNTQPNPTIKVGTEVFGTVGSVLYTLNPSYTRITDLGTSTFVGTLYRPYIASTSISNKIYGAHTGGKLFSYDTVTRSLDLSAGTYQGTPTGYMALDTNGNLYSTDSSGYIYKLTYATTSFVALNTVALLPPVIGPLSVVNDEFLYGADSDSRLVRISISGVAVQRSVVINMAPSSLIVDSNIKSYFYDTSGHGLWSYSPLTKLHDFSGNPLDGTQPVGPIRMDPVKRVLYGICAAGGRGIGSGLRGAGTLFSFDLNTSVHTVLVNYVAGDVNRGETPLDFSITTETGTAYVITRSSRTTFQPRIVGPRVANGFGVGSAQLPGVTTTCFNHGTKILTLINNIEAWVPVENLNIGDLVMTYLHGPRPITHMFKGVMINNPAVWHTCMYKGQKAGFEPLIITGGHGLLVDYLTEEEQAKQQKFWGREEVVIDDKIVMIAPVSAEFTQITDRNIYTYYHFVVENDGDDDRRYGVYANGFLTETPSKNQAVALKYKDYSVY